MKTIEYHYKHTVTESTTGYFACEPQSFTSLEESLAYLYAAPLDDFMHRHVLRELMAKPLAELQALLAQHTQGAMKDIVQTLLMECAILHAPLAAILEEIDTVYVYDNWQKFTPLTYIAWDAMEDKALHKTWSVLLAANITEHEKLPHPEELDEENITPMYSVELLQTNVQEAPHSINIATLHAHFLENPGMAWSRPDAQDTAQRALNLLVENGVLDGVEMRHEASLSPIALQRPWAVHMTVDSGRNNFTLQGQATTYGRGLSLAQTRASYAMEMIERASSYPSIKDNKVLDRDGNIPLYHATYSELVTAGHSVLNPNSFSLEAPYADSPLYWLEARRAPIAVAKEGSDTCFVPAQCVFLFSNLDEITLMMQAGSTGLASGNSLAEAKVAALTEILERDAEATMPYDRKRCFVLRSRDERIASLLDDYSARGIHVHFMDITTEFGVPFYQAFVIDNKFKIIRDTGANL